MHYCSMEFFILTVFWYRSWFSSGGGYVGEFPANEARYRMTFENTGIAMVIFDSETNILFVNKQMEILSGYSKDELEGQKSIFEFIAPEDRPRLFKYHLARRQRTEEAINSPRVYEFKFIPRDKQEKTVLCTVDYLPDLEQSVASFLDITERKAVETETIYLCYHDHLTGLYNRVFFEKSLVEFDKPRYLPIGLIVGDVNGLKLVNDAFGHHTGDLLLQKIAQTV